MYSRARLTGFSHLLNCCIFRDITLCSPSAVQGELSWRGCSSSSSSGRRSRRRPRGSAPGSWPWASCCPSLTASGSSWEEAPPTSPHQHQPSSTYVFTPQTHFPNFEVELFKFFYGFHAVHSCVCGSSQPMSTRGTKHVSPSLRYTLLTLKTSG